MGIMEKKMETTIVQGLGSGGDKGDLLGMGQGTIYLEINVNIYICVYVDICVYTY